MALPETASCEVTEPMATMRPARARINGRAAAQGDFVCAWPGLLDIAVPLMLALVAVRLLIFLLRVGGGGERRLTFWEYLISTGVWLTLALYLLGWLPAVEQALERVALQFGESRVSLSAVLRLALAGSLLLLLSLSISRLLEVRVERPQLAFTRVMVESQLSPVKV